MDAAITEQIIQLEKKLLDKKDPVPNLADLFDEAFIEIGSSGTEYNKNAVIEWLNREDDSQCSGTAFKTHPLADDLILLTYISSIKASSTGEMKQAIRSSIWRLQGYQWRMLFHQVTPKI
ncbi:MAG: hypothetical protein BGO90_15450 [Legionella sp. 40-6]|nr:nuclear transport factor 2 family protein [Legionella sp.]OJY24648.1 MAG: hypothetical protein BGO90_15450 [Legionella sp. 40-6]